MRYFIELSYNGKMYHGWQIQPNANSVQEEMEKALSILLSEKIAVIGCGRTDARVHASQFFLHFDCNLIFDEENLHFKLNAFLPKDIAIIKIFKVNNKAHARFDAICRSYEYRISLRKDPFVTDLALQVNGLEYDIKKMNKAAKLLCTYENFKCFSRSKTDVKTYICTISNAIWQREGNMLIFQISANRFLRNMVRAIVGTLLEIGLGKLNLDDFRKIIESQDRTNAGASVKAHGLFLCKVEYREGILNQNV